MKKRNIYILYALSFLQGMVFYAPIATLNRQAAGIGILQITLLESISMALSLALELPWGVLADRIGYKKTMIACSMLYLASKLVFWRAESFGAFLLERILLATVCAGFSGVDAGMLYLSAPEGESQKCFGIYNSLAQAGLLLAGAVYAAFVGENYRLAGLLTVFSYAAAALLSLGLVEVRREEKSERRGAREFVGVLKGVFRNPALMMLVLAAALLTEAHQTITVFLSQVKLEACGMRGGGFGIAFLFLGAAGLCGGLSKGFTDRLGERRFGSLIYLLGLLCCAVLSFTGNAVAAMVAVVLLRVAYMLSAPLYTRLQNEQVKSGNRATELSVNAVLLDSIAVFSNLIFGRLAEVNISHAMLLGCAFCAAGLLLYNAFFRRIGGQNGK